MKNSEEILDLKIMLNNINAELVKLKVQHHVVSSCLLQVIGEKFPDIEKPLYTNLVNQLEAETLDALRSLDEILYDVNDSSFLIRQEFSETESFYHMKSDDRYVKDEDLNS